MWLFSRLLGLVWWSPSLFDKDRIAININDISPQSLNCLTYKILSELNLICGHEFLPPSSSDLTIISWHFRTDKVIALGVIYTVHILYSIYVLL